MEESVLQPARQLLAGMTLGQYLATQPPRTVMSIAAGDTVGAVLRRFASAGLVAAPLFADEQRSRYLGFLDLMDVVAAVVAAARQPAAGASNSSGHALRHRAAAAACQLAAQPCGSIRAFDNDAQLVYRAQLGNSLLQVVREGFVHPVDNLVCHRLAIYKPTEDAITDASGDTGSAGSAGSAGADMELGSTAGSCNDLAALAPSAAAGLGGGSGTPVQVTNIVSQSDILRFLKRHKKQLGQALLDTTLEQLGVQEKAVMCVPAGMAVVDALAGMVDTKIPAVAVIDSFESGRLLGNLSISDLRGMLPEHFEQMSEPVAEFLRGNGWQQGPRWQPSSPRGGLAAEFGIRSPEVLPHNPSLATCTLQSRFGDILEQLGGQPAHHRVFIVDRERRPAGVLSITDVLRLIVDAPGDAEE